MKIKVIFRKILVILLIVTSLFPALFSGFAYADEAGTVTQERAGNFVASFAINFYNNWSSSNHSFDDGDMKIETKYSESASLSAINESNNSTYIFNKKVWIDFVYSNALGLRDYKLLPSANYGNSGAYEFIDTYDIKNMFEDIKATSSSSADEDKVIKEKYTTVDLMSAGKILPGDILVTSEGDYLLYVGGTKIIYAKSKEEDPKMDGALKYDYYENYIIGTQRMKEEKEGKDKQESKLEDLDPKVGVMQILRISKETAGTIRESQVTTIYNKRGYYDVDNTYSGVPTQGEYNGQTTVSLGSLIIGGLVDVVKFLVNLGNYNFRAVVVGWVSIVESTLQTIVLKISGYKNPVSIIDKFMGVRTTSYSGTRITVESLLFNKLPLTDANFFNYKKAGGFDLLAKDGTPVTWIYNFRLGLASIYVLIRNLTIAIMLFVLIYAGIRMALSTIPEKKANYSKMLTGWLTGLCIILFIHIFMYAVLYFNGMFVDALFEMSSDVASDIIGGNVESISLYDAIRTKAYSFEYYEGMVGTILYIIFVYYFIKYLIIYVKRAVAIYVLALFGSFTGVKYAIETASGSRKSSLMKWIKEFFFNVFLQTIHCVIYVVMVSIALSSALTSFGGIIIAIVVFQFIMDADKIVMNVFGIRGSLLDEVRKPPAKMNEFISKARNVLIFGVLPFQAAKSLFSSNGSLRTAIRFAKEYKPDDKYDDIMERAEARRLNEVARRNTALYGMTADNLSRISKTLEKIKLTKKMAVSIRQMSLVAEQRRKSYKALGTTKGYEAKKIIFNLVQKDKKTRSSRYTRALGVGKNYIAGSAKLIASVGVLSEGLTPALVLAISGARSLGVKGKDKRALRLKRKLTPGKNWPVTQIGALQLASEKAERDIKKFSEIEDKQIDIVAEEDAIGRDIEQIKSDLGLTDEEMLEVLHPMFNAVNRSTLTGASIRRAVDEYMGNVKFKNSLTSEDIDEIVDIIRSNAPAGSIINETLIRTTLRDNGFKLENATNEDIANKIIQSITGNASDDEIRTAVKNYANGLKAKLGMDDIDGILQILGENLQRNGSSIIIDSTLIARVKESVLNVNGGDIGKVESKEMARIIAEAASEPDVVPIVAGGKVNAVVEETLERKIIYDIYDKYESETGTTLTQEEKRDISRTIGKIDGINNMSQDKIRETIISRIGNLQGFDGTAMEEAVNSATEGEVRVLGERDIDKIVKGIEKKMGTALNVNIPDTVKDDIRTRTSSITNNLASEESRIRTEIRRATDEDRKAELRAELNRARRRANEEIMNAVYQEVSKPGVVSANNDNDPVKKARMNALAKRLRRINALNHGMLAKNKKTAVSTHVILEQIYKSLGEED